MCRAPFVLMQYFDDFWGCSFFGCWGTIRLSILRRCISFPCAVVPTRFTVTHEPCNYLAYWVGLGAIVNPILVYGIKCILEQFIGTESFLGFRLWDERVTNRPRTVVATATDGHMIVVILFRVDLFGTIREAAYTAPNRRSRVEENRLHVFRILLGALGHIGPRRRMTTARRAGPRAGCLLDHYKVEVENHVKLKLKSQNSWIASLGQKWRREGSVRV